jgi:hypothetical protein
VGAWPLTPTPFPTHTPESTLRQNFRSNRKNKSGILEKAKNQGSVSPRKKKVKLGPFFTLFSIESIMQSGAKGRVARFWVEIESGIKKKGTRGGTLPLSWNGRSKAWSSLNPNLKCKLIKMKMGKKSFWVEMLESKKFPRFFFCMDVCARFLPHNLLVVL